MAIQYSGLTIVNTTFTTTTGTRQEVVNGLAAALLSAGWTRVAGSSGGADQTFLSMTTPQGYAIRLRLLEPGTGSCAQIFLQNASGSLANTTNPIFLLPTAAGQYRVIASGYQVFVSVPTITATARTVACAGVPFVPSFLTSFITAIGFLGGNASSDTDTSVRNSFRTALTWHSASSGNQQGLYNTNIWNSTAASNAQGNISLWYFHTPAGNVGITAYRYPDGSAMITDPLIGWGQTGVGSEQMLYGQLWDAAIITDNFTADISASFDSHNWFCFTQNGSTTDGRGSLFLVVP